MMKREVFSDVKAPVEKVEITTAQTNAGHQNFSRRIYMAGAVARVVRSRPAFARMRHIIQSGSSVLRV